MQYLSIHDLTQRSTLICSSVNPCAFLSIHDLTQRSTCFFDYKYHRINNFQFTTSRRGRQIPQLLWLVCFPFQFTTSRRGRLQKMQERKMRKAFQFTTSRRGRPPIGQRHLPPILHFQFTTSRRGRPFPGRILDRRKELSIHDLTQRSTIRRAQNQQRKNLSIHDLTQRSTSPRGVEKYSGLTFNSRPHAEVDS